MVGTLVAMLPLVALGGVALGWPGLVHPLVGLAAACAAHFLALGAERWGFKRVLHPSFASSAVAGLIAGLSVLAATPYAVTAGIAVLAIFIKFLQGWAFGRKYLNPVATAKALLLLAMTAASGLARGLILHPHHLEWVDMWSREGFTGALWFLSQGDWDPGLSLFLWKTHSWIGGVSGLATLTVGVLAVWRLRLKWRISLAFLGTMAALALVLASITGGALLWRLAFHLFTGSVIFLAFFMATEPQSTPMSAGSQPLRAGPGDPHILPPTDKRVGRFGVGSGDDEPPHPASGPGGAG